VLNAKITALTRQAAQANREIKRLTDENRRLGEELTKIKRFPAVPPEAAEEMRELQRKNANLQSSVADLDDQRQQLAEACDALEKRNEELSNELNKRPATTGARGRKPPVGAATSDAGSRRTRSRSVTQQQQQAERTQLEETQHEEDDAGVVETQRHGGADSL
jgi:DNA repair exonuclease SbcCD ATPase subunit